MKANDRLRTFAFFAMSASMFKPDSYQTSAIRGRPEPPRSYRIWLLSMFAYIHAGFFGLFAALGIFNDTSRSVLIQQVIIAAIGVGVVLACRNAMHRRQVVFEQQQLNMYEAGVRAVDLGPIIDAD